MTLGTATAGALLQANVATHEFTRPLPAHPGVRVIRSKHQPIRYEGL